MSTPFYVSPQQAMADRADTPQGHRPWSQPRCAAVRRRHCVRRREPVRALHKFSEIYDRIGFAAAGKYNEYENLRIGGVRYADLRGYTYDRDDVTARGLANVYAQTLGTIFSSAAEKPYEVELVVAEVGTEPEGDQIYRLPHDGSIVDEHGSVAVGGNAEQISGFLDQRHRDGMTLAEALKLAVQAPRASRSCCSPARGRQLHPGRRARRRVRPGHRSRAAVRPRGRPVQGSRASSSRPPCSSALGMTLLALTGLGSLPLAYLAVVVAGRRTRPWRAVCGPCGRASSRARARCTGPTPWTPWRRRSCSPSDRSW
ncbi:Proteasome subunit alpha [Streptomyces badius]